MPILRKDNHSRHSSRFTIFFPHFVITPHHFSFPDVYEYKALPDLIPYFESTENPLKRQILVRLKKQADDQAIG